MFRLDDKGIFPSDLRRIQVHEPGFFIPDLHTAAVFRSVGILDNQRLQHVLLEDGTDRVVVPLKDMKIFRSDSTAATSAGFKT